MKNKDIFYKWETAKTIRNVKYKIIGNRVYFMGADNFNDVVDVIFPAARNYWKIARDIYSSLCCSPFIELHGFSYGGVCAQRVGRQLRKYCKNIPIQAFCYNSPCVNGGLYVRFFRTSWDFVSLVRFKKPANSYTFKIRANPFNFIKNHFKIMDFY